jgi:hypothetical protein
VVRAGATLCSSSAQEESRLKRRSWETQSPPLLNATAHFHLCCCRCPGICRPAAKIHYYTNTEFHRKLCLRRLKLLNHVYRPRLHFPRTHATSNQVSSNLQRQHSHHQSIEWQNRDRRPALNPDFVCERHQCDEWFESEHHRAGCGRGFADCRTGGHRQQWQCGIVNPA